MVHEFYPRGIKPIREKILENNYLFTLQFNGGFLYGRTINRRLCVWEPYPLIDTNGVIVDLAATTYQPEIRLRDPRNIKNEILYLNDTTNGDYPWFYHGAIGIKPQFINMYYRLPESKDMPGKFPNVDPIRPSSGDNFGYINGLLSPYDEPTDVVEVVLPPKTYLGHEFYNRDNRNHNPVLNLYFALYWVEFFNKDKNPQIIRQIARREVPASFLTVGFGDVPYDFSNILRADWKTDLLTLKEAVE